MSAGPLPGYSQRLPVHAARVRSHRLTPPGAAKDTHHHVISLAEAGIAYRPGDSLGIWARNPDSLVEAILTRLDARGDEPVSLGTETVPLRAALAGRFDLLLPSRRLLEACAQQGIDRFAPLLQKGHEAQLKEYLQATDRSHDVLDVLEDARAARFTPQEFIGLLRAMQPRLYSIASSERRHPDEAHLLVLTLTYTIRDRVRLGVGSTFTNERWPLGTTAPVYVQDAQKHFALPADPATPIIMIGPGTGVAPFRAFLEEREAIGAPGRNWLFFGEQSRAWGFYYEEDFTAWQARGRLRLDLAFSRDQPQKIYVQHRMRESSRDLYAWLEEGAEVFICGDKARMASDVQAELAQIVQREGGRTPDQAAEYLATLRKLRRLKLDVYRKKANGDSPRFSARRKRGLSPFSARETGTVPVFSRAAADRPPPRRRGRTTRAARGRSSAAGAPRQAAAPRCWSTAPSEAGPSSFRESLGQRRPAPRTRSGQ
jgi:sulfite reductase (NADPH) flavoprotein alpha-component